MGVTRLLPSNTQNEVVNIPHTHGVVCLQQWQQYIAHTQQKLKQTFSLKLRNDINIGRTNCCVVMNIHKPVTNSSTDIGSSQPHPWFHSKREGLDMDSEMGRIQIRMKCYCVPVMAPSGQCWEVLL